MERTVEDLPYLEMARLFFSENELGELTSLQKSAQISAFYRCWTRKEAYLKGCGRGLSLLPPHSFDVSLLPDHPPALLVHRLSPSEKERWRIVDLNAPQGFCAALAVERVLPVIRYITCD